MSAASDRIAAPRTAIAPVYDLTWAAHRVAYVEAVTTPSQAPFTGLLERHGRALAGTIGQARPQNPRRIVFFPFEYLQL